MMRKNSKKLLAVFFSLIMAMTAFFPAFAQPVRAKTLEKKSAPDKRRYLLQSAGTEDDSDSEKGLHADPATFQKNLTLSFDQKEYTITECEKVV